MIFLSNVSGDINGFISFEESQANSNTETAEARVQVDKLLDGTTYVKLHGQSDGDRQLQISSKKTQPESVCDNVQRLFRLNTKFLLSTRHGFYLGVLKRISTNQGRVLFTFIPEQKF